MISVKRLKELLEQVPDDAYLHAYEGEDRGISIYTPHDRPFNTNENPEATRYWWIRATEDDEIDTHIEGF